jgi:hypothetical protein
MSNKRSEARKSYWASRTQEERTNHARHAALVRHANMSSEDKLLLINSLKNGKRIKKDASNNN